MLVKKPNRRSFQVLDCVNDTSNIREIDEFIKDSSNGCKIHTKIHGCGFNAIYSLVLEDRSGELYDVNPGANLIKSNKKEVCVLTEEQYKILFE